MTDVTDGLLANSSANAYCELHVRSAFSRLRAGSGVEALVARAAALGMPALALTDYMTLAGMVRFQQACTRHGVRPIAGAELAVAAPVFGDSDAPALFVALARNAEGYANLCALLTEANLAAPEAPIIPYARLVALRSGLLLLTGGRDGALARLLLAGRSQEATTLAAQYRCDFGDDLFVEIQHHALPDDALLAQRLATLAEDAGLGTVLTNGVCYATRTDYPVYDLLTCVRLGISVDQPHRDRAANSEAHLKSADEMRTLLAGQPWADEALAASVRIAERCETISLVRTVCRAPQVTLPEGVTPASHLRALCETGLRERFVHSPAALAPESAYRRQVAHELETITRLELEEFFLCVAEIVRQARSLGIRCSGRGSAANSLVAYLLGITGVDPLAHGLLFERFLNPDRRGMPDIDIDVASDRREELIRWVERRYTHAHAAMVANVITYRARSALRDVAKALGYPLPLINRLTKLLSHHASRDDLARAQADAGRLVAAWTAWEGDASACALAQQRARDRLPLLFALAPRLLGLPRHLSLHNGGIVLTREPLARTLAVRVSANGVRALEIDKDDVEACGLIKFDLLGLRTLGAIEEALTLIEETTGTRPAIDHLPMTPPDPATMRLIRSGQTLAVFQIESPGQWHLLAQTQPRSFDDIIIQTALFRPGPIQGGFVRPYVARRQAQANARGASDSAPALALLSHPNAHPNSGQNARPTQRDAVQTPWQGAPADDFWTSHPVLGPLLADTSGILLFQEQILSIAHAYAGLTYAEADGFRRAMSHAREPAEMEAMREQFLAGAIARGERIGDAERVFSAIAAYVGYGFCKSHAAEFARTIYLSAWLKAHYPAHYLAAFLSSQPAGFFPPHVVLEEAKYLGIPALPVEINRSMARFSIEWVGAREGTRGRPGRWAIRLGLEQVRSVGEDVARAILWERGGTHGEVRPFRSLADFCRRMRQGGLTWEAAEALVLCGAFTLLHPGLDRRQILWHLHELWLLVSTRRQPTARRRRGQSAMPREEVEQLAIEWVVPEVAPNGLLPALPALDREERSALDYALLGMSARPHPVALLRRTLRRRGVQSIAELAEAPARRVVRVAGWPISVQRPPTAHGFGFLTLEDETGRLPVAVPPKLAAQLYPLIRSARVICVTGQVERVRWYRSLLARDLCPLTSAG